MYFVRVESWPGDAKRSTEAAESAAEWIIGQITQHSRLELTFKVGPPDASRTDCEVQVKMSFDRGSRAPLTRHF